MKTVTSLQPQRTITVHDTLERLNYAKRPTFDALWEPKNTIGISVKAIEKRYILGDKYLESTIKERPRKHMVPSVSLYDVQDKDERKLMINFIYKTTTNQAAKKVWGGFKIQRSCLSKKDVQQEGPLSNQQVVSRLQDFKELLRNGTLHSMQSRSFLVDDTCYDKKNKAQKEKIIEAEIHACEEISEKERTIRKLINEDKLSIIYDKLSSSYTGYRPYIACGVPIEKKETYQSAN